MVFSMIMVGILLIIISIVLMIKNRKNENIKYEKCIKIYNEITEYSTVINDIIIDLENLISTNSLSNINEENKLSENTIIEDEKDDEVVESNTINMKDKVIQLYKHGNSIDKIAKTLNKGKREIDMIVKLNYLNKK